jgi:hypothetical protein
MPWAITSWNIDVRGIHVARHDGEELDVLGAQRAGERRAVAYGDLVERAVLDELGRHAGSSLAAFGRRAVRAPAKASPRQR